MLRGSGRTSSERWQTTASGGTQGIENIRGCWRRIPGRRDSSLFDADDHGFGADQMLHPGFAEAGLAHPGTTLGARIVESPGSLDEHVQAHQETERILPGFVNEPFEDDECPLARQRGMCLGNQHLLLDQVPIVEDVPHQQHVGGGQRVGEEIAGLELNALLEPE